MLESYSKQNITLSFVTNWKERITLNGEVLLLEINENYLELLKRRKQLREKRDKLMYTEETFYPFLVGSKVGVRISVQK